ncbi:MAG: DUF72 domain-containing protein [Pseudomonadales bacterium]|jgi:uncharacterized protein YecE (DUF72 family)
MTMEVRAGTSGYSYKEWRGRFYPPDVPQDEWLGYYAERLPTVEINNTFYRMPRTHVVQTWRDTVPGTFRFVIKASRRITHQKRLHDVSEPLGFLLNRAEILGEKLGALLFQLPPYMPADLERLESFQADLPVDFPAAFEFRHRSWDDPAVDESLARYGHARVVSHETGAPPARLTDGPLLYLRLRAPGYTATALGRWHEKVVASGAERAYVFFKHEDGAAGPQMAARFLALESKPAPRRAAKRGAATAPEATSGTDEPARPAADRPRPRAATRRSGPGSRKRR